MAMRRGRYDADGGKMHGCGKKKEDGDPVAVDYYRPTAMESAGPLICDPQHVPRCPGLIAVL
jgi:hypothetical protein